MIKFFRKIRYQLLGEGNTGKYLKYAIGEVILVVIGILIALSINNWNESRKAHEFEIKMLKEVRLALIEDKSHFELMVGNMNQLKNNVDFFIDYIADGNTFTDSIFSKMFGLNIEISILYNRGPYEAIKSSGIDKIAKDSLRNNIIKFYDFEYPNLISEIKHYNRTSTRDLDQLVGLMQVPQIINNNQKPRIIQTFPRNVFEQPEFLLLLNSHQFRSRRVRRTIEELTPLIQNLINQIEFEIKITKG